MALTWLTLFLTFDLVVFGAFTRLTDSGLGCPDWPGCYGSVSPIGADVHIDRAEAALPSGPVTERKAWIEMIHRYLAGSVGALILVMAACHVAWAQRVRRDRQASPSPTLQPGWILLTLLWVCGQGAFGALTVTMKLYPAIVTLHLLGGIGLLALLAVMARRQQLASAGALEPAGADSALRRPMQVCLALLLVQVALGGWVSTNYAVLACSDFPTCQGQWWPVMDAQGLWPWRDLGQTAQGDPLPFAALTAIHLLHRAGAGVVALALTLLSLALWRLPHGQGREAARVVLAALVWQVLSGISNVVLGWPLAAALAHTAGAAFLVAWLAALCTRAPRRSGAAALQPSHPSSSFSLRSQHQS
jgi:cytochrome c oxidase assembly protein subunit 15